MRTFKQAKMTQKTQYRRVGDRRDLTMVLVLSPRRGFVLKNKARIVPLVFGAAISLFFFATRRSFSPAHLDRVELSDDLRDLLVRSRATA